MRKGDLPGALDLPTGLGKTSAMSIWLVALAEGATLPRRLVYVVDRRAVVDQATGVAEKLRELVEATPALKSALGLTGPLPISTLRGRFVDNRQWLADPGSPAIVVGTVDMIGSRLLFEGYGVSRRMRPYHAGLLGTDTLVILDEAHLVPPFERLVEQIERATAPGGSLAPRSKDSGIVPRMRLISLSATGRSRQNPLVLSDADRSHPVVAERLGAKKRLRIQDPVPGKELAQHLADAAWSLTESRPTRCIVFTNSRDDAQSVAERLAVRDADVELLVGARRIFERQESARWLSTRGLLAGERGTPSKPTFLVATSAGEVGIDLDADHMVCDLVAWERMVQRLGRVNRRGNGDAQVIVIPQADPNDPDRIDSARALLHRLPSVNSEHDASPAALMALRASSPADIEAASTPPPLHPPLSRPLVESWSMTSLEDHTGRPPVQPWVRGWIDAEDPHTTVLFRRELPLNEHGECLPDGALTAYFEAAPPHLKEMIETETWRVMAWLEARCKSLLKNPTQEEQGQERPTRLRPSDIVGLVVDGSSLVREIRLLDLTSPSDRRRALADLQRDLEGHTLLLDVRIGGLRQGLLDDEHPLATDVGDATEAGTPALPFRITRVAVGFEQEPIADTSTHREEARLCTSWQDGTETSWLVIETLPGESAESEDGRSVAPSRAQMLEEHEEWTEREARQLAKRLRLGEPYSSVLALAGRLHDEGKRAPNWQRAFGVGAGELAAGQAYGKTTHRPNLALLNGYRHELGSLPRAERDARVQGLSPDLRDLCLHLIAAHHGFARPLIRTDGAEEPPSQLTRRAQEIALRFTRLEKTWGPWGLAWWESLLRAADQRASRLNDAGGRP